MSKFTDILTISLLLAAAPATTLVAQEKSRDELKYEINSIKKDPLYIYAESTTENRDDAMDMAIEALEGKARMWVKLQREVRQLPANLEIADIDDVCGRIEMPRGNMNRAFVYIKKDDIFRTGGSRTEARNQQAEEARRNVAPATAEPFGTPKQPAAQPAPAPAVHPAIARLLTLKKYDEVVPMLDGLKAEGLVASYARYAQLGNPNDYVLIIYNRQAQIEAILSTGASRTNLATGAPDGVDNYKGRGAIGVKLQ